MEPFVVSNIAASLSNWRMEMCQGKLVTEISRWDLREQFQKTEWLREMGSGASQYKQDLQKYLVIGRKKQGELTESERRLREEMRMIF